jgi:glycosyltransferase involved in cell wall biosynthesis
MMNLAKNTSSTNASPHLPRITVIVATLNAVKTIDRCLQSIIRQTYPNKAIIVMDGGSTDGSIECIKGFARHLAYWETEPDQGIYHAWNKAVKLSHGEWLCFLGADDYFRDDQVLSAFIPHLLQSRNTGIRLVYSRVAQVTDRGEVLKYSGKPWSQIHWQMRHGMPLPHPGLMHHFSLFNDHGLFDESFQIAGDYEFLLRELKTGAASFIPNLCSVNQQIGGISHARNLLAHREVSRARVKNGLPAVTWAWLLVYFRAILRHYWKRIRR